jgi:hypothetical protein
VADKILYLFSSNAQPLYSQNVLNFIAAPRGAVHMLRYEETWVHKDLRSDWRADNLEGYRALLHFSFQHDEQYVEPALLPVRWATVIATRTDGAFYFVRVRVDEDVALKAPPAVEGLEPWQAKHPHAVRISEYRNELAYHNVPKPYPSSASRGPSPATWSTPLLDSKLTAPDALRRHAEYLSRVTPLADAQFVRLLSINDATSGDEVPYGGGNPPWVVLKGGRPYRLNFFSFQPHGFSSPSVFEATADSSVVSFVGAAGFEVAGHYDRPEVLIKTAVPQVGNPLTTMLAIRGAAGTMAPRIDVPIQVKADAKASLFGATAAALVLVGLAVAPLLGDGWQPAVAVGAALLGVVMQFTRWQLPGFGSTLQTALKPHSAAVGSGEAPPTPGGAPLGSQ